ncbi:hypothetical protein [Clostridium sp.]|uniref:hypothetical protein n=1 Tax=Clostridium sp. TaxID=1506 RepID=UPI0034644AA5
MKQFFKKHIRLVTVIGVLFIIYMGYLTLKESVNVDEELDKAISNYILDNFRDKFDAGHKQFEAHKIYGIEEKDGLINVYMYSLYEGYSFVNKKFKLQGGGSHPVLMIFKKNDGRYSVVEYREPVSGSEYGDSIIAMFPSKYAKEAINYDTRNAAGLSGNIRKQTKKWLKEEGKSGFILE